MNGGSQKILKKSWKSNVSILWKHLLMMLGILCMTIIAMIVFYHRSLEVLTEENLSKMQLSFNRDCGILADTIYKTSAIPDGIEGTRYFDYLKGQTSGALDTKYYSVLPLIHKALSNQLYLQGKNEECFVYLSGCNCIISRSRSYPVAENCFRDYISFSSTGTQSLLGLLREKDLVKLLPMQSVSIQGNPKQCMALIIHPRDNTIAVMTLYSEETILDYLGMPNLPKDTRLQITASDGELLYAYPDPWTGEESEKGYLFSCGLDPIGASARICIPAEYFDTVLSPVRALGIGAIVIVTLIGILLSFALAKVSVKPIRQLISTHNGENERYDLNEIISLDRILNKTQQENEYMQLMLTQQILSCAMHGIILSEEQEKYLELEISGLSGSYRIAIVHTSCEISEIAQWYPTRLLSDCLWTVNGKSEIGVMLHGGENRLVGFSHDIQTLLEQMRQEGESLSCGISCAMTDVEELHNAVLQARKAVMQGEGIHVSQGWQRNSRDLPWGTHERLYQYIVSQDLARALQLLDKIATHTVPENAPESYYHIRFVIRKAASEMGIPLPDDLFPDYTPSRLPRENILNLSAALKWLEETLEQKNLSAQEDEHGQIMEYIRHNADNYALCAALVSSHFGITERRVYETVRLETDKSFNQYLIDLRMKKAAELLCSSQYSVRDVAEKCGYQGDSTFYRIFKKYYGVAPGTFRQNALSNEN